jgi:hypothetical protein
VSPRSDIIARPGIAAEEAKRIKEASMGIFDSLKHAIFGGQSQAQPPPQPSAYSPTQPQTQATTTARPSATASAAPSPQVDIEAVLTGMAARKSEKLNWQSSIVDLMKLVDLNPSLENRKTLAGELGYTGDTQDSASMNIWLHHEVMEKLAAAGGKVPDSLRH